ncbi:NADPH:quinone reductase [Streptomyces sp. NPDC020490]|uniref:NADPH:quinone reductase n=1 Tax=Streptomyces sp. NPDC020490 TaxID=3365078 RepID=UPI003797FE3F
MRAAWYERTGPAAEVITVGELPAPRPGPGEVRVRIQVAGVNPADVKRRAGTGGRTMLFTRIVPGDDGAGVIDLVGPNVPLSRIGQRVWVHSANYKRQWGTAAEYSVVPSLNAIELPPHVSFDAGACLGVPALTAHRSVFADGPVAGQTVLITGGAGAVAHYAIELAKSAGATVIATASTVEKQRAARAAGADEVVDYRSADAVSSIQRFTGPRGADRIIDVAFGANLAMTVDLIAENGVIATYGSDASPEPTIPFYPLMRKGVTLRTISVFAMPTEAKHAAVEHLNALLDRNALTHPTDSCRPLDDIVQVHSDLEQGKNIGRVLITVP